MGNVDLLGGTTVEKIRQGKSGDFRGHSHGDVAAVVETPRHDDVPRTIRIGYSGDRMKSFSCKRGGHLKAILPAMLLITSLACFALAREDVVKEEMNKLQGSWKLTAFEVDGQKVEIDPAATNRIIIRD